MRLSKLKHTLAVLRTFLGLTQRKMAELAGCKSPTIQAIELGKLNLSARLAQAIAEATGCDLRWLMDNNTSASIRNSRGENYTRVDYEDARITAEAGRMPELFYMRRVILTEFAIDCTRLARTLVAAFEKKSYPRWRYRMEMALEEFEKGFWPEHHKAGKLPAHTKEFWDAVKKARNSTPELVESNPSGNGYPSMEILERTLAKALRMACGRLRKKYLGRKPAAERRPRRNRISKSSRRSTKG